MSEKLEDQPLMEHITALRAALLHIIAAVLILFLPAYAVSSRIIDFLIAYSCPEQMRNLAFFSPMEAFMVEMKTALVTSCAVAFPYSLYQLWRFLAPALYSNEKRALKCWVGASSLLFVSGAAFCFFVITPIVMNFSASFATENLRPVIGLANFMDMLLWMLFAFGLMFQFPIVMLAAISLGVVDVETLAKKRPYVIVMILILAAILTPPDVLSQILLSLPCWLLFELALVCARMMKKREELRTSSETQECASAMPEQKNDAILDFYENEKNK